MSEEQAKRKKRCTGPCDRLLPATSEFFHRDKQKPDGLQPQCKVCRNEKTELSIINQRYESEDWPRRRIIIIIQRITSVFLSVRKPIEASHKYESAYWFDRKHISIVQRYGNGEVPE